MLESPAATCAWGRSNLARPPRRLPTWLRGRTADQPAPCSRWAAPAVCRLRYMYRSRIYVDREGLERVRTLSSTHTMVFVPTHKSHLDYMVFCYILFVYGLTCPHIAAGARLQVTASSSCLIITTCQQLMPELMPELKLIPVSALLICAKSGARVTSVFINVMQNAAPTAVAAAAPQQHRRLVEQGVQVLMRALRALTCACRHQPEPARGRPHPARPGRLLHPPQVHGPAGQLPVPRGAGRCGRARPAHCWQQRMRAEEAAAMRQICIMPHALHAACSASMPGKASGVGAGARHGRAAGGT